MRARAAGKNRSRAPAPYVSNLGGSAGERVLPSGPGFPTALAQRLPEERDALQRLAAIHAANCTELIACHDAAGRIRWASERAQEVLGRPVGALLGRTLDDLAAPEDRAVVALAFARLRDNGGTVTRSYRVRLRNGRRRRVESTFRAIADRSGELREVQSSTRNADAGGATANHLGAEERRAFARLRGLAAHLQTVREEERCAIAREIHDDLGHHLTAIGLELSGLARELRDSAPELTARVKRMQASSVEVLSSVRRLVTELRPAVLDGFGLPAAIEWQADEAARRLSIPIRVELETDMLELDSSTAVAVFRIFQEALTNVARHADATSVYTTLRSTQGRLVLEVRDDGRGFEPASASARSFGLLGMRERALALGGALHIDSSIGSGTSIRLEVPL